MKNHGHDIHYMLIVLILAFFVITLSYNQVNPDIAAATGHVTRSNFLTGYSVSDINVVDGSGFLPPIRFFRGNLGGSATATEDNPDTTATSCEWINLNNEVFGRIKSMSGFSACRTLDYGSCMMTNVKGAKNYYGTNDGSCEDVTYRDESNSLGNCYTTIKTQSSPCFTESVDVTENSFTTVYCCR